MLLYHPVRPWHIYCVSPVHSQIGPCSHYDLMSKTTSRGGQARILFRLHRCVDSDLSTTWADYRLCINKKKGLVRPHTPAWALNYLSWRPGTAIAKSKQRSLQSHKSSLFGHRSGGTSSMPMSGLQSRSPASTRVPRLTCSLEFSRTLPSLPLSPHCPSLTLLKTPLLHTYYFASCSNLSKLVEYWEWANLYEHTYCTDSNIKFCLFFLKMYLL